jgi:multisubunit Na+/H+ antiporter MnhE subunit
MRRASSPEAERRLRLVSVIVLWVAAAVAWLNVSENRASRAGFVGAVVASVAAVVQTVLPAIRRRWGARDMRAGT